MDYLAILKKADEERERQANPEKAQGLADPTPDPGQPHWWEPGAVCWHCQGSGACRCIACDDGGPCVVCKGTGRIQERIQ